MVKHCAVQVALDILYLHVGVGYVESNNWSAFKAAAGVNRPLAVALSYFHVTLPICT